MPEATTLDDTYFDDTETDIAISPLDPDWLLMLLFAILVDTADIVITILGILDLWTITTLISWIIDGCVFAIIGGWMMWRTGQIVKSKRERREALAKELKHEAAEKAPKLAEAPLARLANRPAGRTSIRAAASFLGELIPFIGCIPFWTIGMFTMLREKGE